MLRSTACTEQLIIQGAQITTHDSRLTTDRNRGTRYASLEKEHSDYLIDHEPRLWDFVPHSQLCFASVMHLPFGAVGTWLVHLLPQADEEPFLTAAPFIKRFHSSQSSEF